MKLIVTGASGFIGKNFLLKAPKNWKIKGFYWKDPDFCGFLKKNNLINVEPIKCDLTKINQTRTVFQKFGKDWDTCLYLAAKVNIPESVKDPISDLECNTAALLNFLNFFRGKRFVFMSSGAVYDGIKGGVYPGVALNPTLPYAISKLASEQYIKCFQERKQTIKEYTIIRFFGAYGPYEPSYKIYTKMLETFCIRKEDKFTIRGDGKNIINAMYVEDAIRALLKIVNNKISNITVDLYGNELVSINGLVRKTEKVLGVKKLNIIYKGGVPEYITFYSIDDSMKKIFNFSPIIPLEEGILKFKKFFLKYARK